MIHIGQEEPGQIKIDFSDQATFAGSPDAFELSSGLFVVATASNYIVADDAGHPTAVVDFVADFLRQHGYEISIDSQLASRIERSQSEFALIEAIRSGKQQPVPIRSAAKFGVKLRMLPHQLRGLAHALAVKNGANFSVPGSGKTAVALSFYAALKQDNLIQQLMVIGPASSFVPWQEEFQAVFGHPPNAVRLIGALRKRVELLRAAKEAGLVLCTYQMAYHERANLKELLARGSFLLVLDESHHIKNIQLKPWAASVVELAPFASRRMILTGTPAPHSLKDLWSQFTFLWPSQALMRNRAQFEQRLQSSRNPTRDLKATIKPFFIRTKRSELRLPLPRYRFHPIPYKAIPKRQRLIIRLLELRTLQEAKNVGLGASDINVLKVWRRARIIRLLQASSNPALLGTTSNELGDPGASMESEPTLAKLLHGYLRAELPAKLDWTIRETRKLVSKGQKVVIWSSWVMNLRLLHRLLADLSPLLAFGGVPAYEEDVAPGFESREKNIREFRLRKDRPVLIANPGACSESISLHRECHHAIYLDRTFNCGQFLQSMDRILRVGMPPRTRATYHIPLIPSVIETVLDKRLTQRQKVLYELLDDDMPVLGYEEDWSLLERDNDLDQIFEEVTQELQKRADKTPARAAKRTRTRR